MNILTFLPFIVLIGAMFLMTRSAKNKQRQAAHMREQMQPGTGVRTIGGMYATVKEVGEDTALLEVAPGVHAIYAKNAIGAVLDDAEYNRIVHGIESDGDLSADESADLEDAHAAPVAPADPADGDTPQIDLGKPEAAEAAGSSDAAEAKTDAKADVKADAKTDAAEAEDAKTTGDADAK